MKILVITTPPNAVLTAVKNIGGAEIYTVNCSINVRTIGVRVSKAVDLFRPDIILTYRCPYILPKSVYTNVSKFAINIHPSLLPKYSGLNPWDDMCLAKEQIGGVTIHYLSDIPDTGKIIIQKSYVIDPREPITIARCKADEIASKLIVPIITKVD